MRVTQKFLTWAKRVEPGINVFLGDRWDDEDMWVAHTDPGWVCQQAFDNAIKCWNLFHAGDRTAAAAALRSAMAAVE